MQSQDERDAHTPTDGASIDGGGLRRASIGSTDSSPARRRERSIVIDDDHVVENDVLVSGGAAPYPHFLPAGCSPSRTA